MAVVSEPIPGVPAGMRAVDASRRAAALESDEICEDIAISLPCQRVRVYVWQIPVRVTHWVVVASIMVLSVTGGYIADPFIVPPGGAFMETVRFVHLMAAFAFLAAGIVRTYWLFAGNQFSRWTAFIPTNRRHLREVATQTGWYLFLRKELPGILGHNALAGGTYFVVFFLFLVQTITGFALVGVHGDQPWASLFGWTIGFFGIQTVRFVHHILMWAVLAFMIHHVYSALLVDHWEKSGLMSSIFSGYKFVTRRQIADARDGGIEIQEISE